MIICHKINELSPYHQEKNDRIHPISAIFDDFDSHFTGFNTKIEVVD